VNSFVLAIATGLWAASLAAADGQFRLQRVDADTWRAELCFAEPVTAYRFDRPVKGYRESSWRVTQPDFELRFGEGAAELWRLDGEPYRCGAVDITTWEELPEQNYYAFSSFSDGGVSVYTGYFTGLVQRDGIWRDAKLNAEYRGREGERVITREPNRLVEQFVYFGRQPMQETSSVIAVIDPAMPGDARDRILDTGLAVNALLEQVFGFRPESPYVIFMATNLQAFDGSSIKGGALDGQIEFNLKGRGVLALIERDPFHFPKTTAHEVIHLWQRDHWFGDLGSDQPWVHEGSADALAYEVLSRTGIYDGKEYAAAWQETENACAKGLQSASVHSGPETGYFDIVYTCGALVNLFVGEMLNPEHPGAGIIRFWQEMADWPAEDRRGASEELFFRTLEKLASQSGPTLAEGEAHQSRPCAGS
jgi:hypothetical protein